MNENEWISVKDSLPPDSDEAILVWHPMDDEPGEVLIVWFDPKGIDLPHSGPWHTGHTESIEFDRITHWMPLPTPPEAS